MEEDPTKVPQIPGDDHAEFRDQFVTRHPDVLLPHHREPHKKLVERIQRDFLVHGSVPFYEVGELRARSETLVQKSGLTKSSVAQGRDGGSTFHGSVGVPGHGQAARFLCGS